MDTLSIQDRLWTDANCFGCGPANARGLRLKSFRSGELVTASFLPWPEHDNGLGYLNGGIIATLLDCHSAAAVMDEADQNGWAPAPGAVFAFVTAGLDVRYLRPSPLDSAVALRAGIVASSEAEIRCEVELHHDDKVRATGHAVWKRWRARQP